MPINIPRNLQILTGAAVVHQHDSSALSGARAAMEAVGPALLCSPMPVATCTLSRQSTSAPQFNIARKHQHWQLAGNVYVVEYGPVTPMTVPLLLDLDLFAARCSHCAHVYHAYGRLNFGLMHMSGLQYQMFLQLEAEYIKELLKDAPVETIQHLRAAVQQGECAAVNKIWQHLALESAREAPLQFHTISGCPLRETMMPKEGICHLQNAVEFLVPKQLLWDSRRTILTADSGTPHPLQATPEHRDTHLCSECRSTRWYYFTTSVRRGFFRSIWCSH
jgi:hypothetical protein